MLVAPLLAGLALGGGEPDPQVSAAQAGAQENPFPNVLVTFEPQLFGKVGIRRAGLLCLPAGTIYGAPIYRSLRYHASAMMRFALREQGHTSRSAHVALKNVQELQAEVRALSMKACARNWGFGDRSSVAGSVRISILWTARRLNADQSTMSYQIDSELDWPQASGSVIDLVEAAFEESARQFVSAVLLQSAP